MTDMSSLIKRPGATPPASLDAPPGTPLEASLDRLEVINRQLGDMAARGGDGAGAAIVGLRHDFAAECGTLLLAMCADERVFDQRQLFVDLQTGLDALRARVTNHQLRWQGDRIEADRAGYSEASKHLNAAIVSFIGQCRSAVAG